MLWTTKSVFRIHFFDFIGDYKEYFHNNSFHRSQDKQNIEVLITTKISGGKFSNNQNTNYLLSFDSNLAHKSSSRILCFKINKKQ